MSSEFGPSSCTTSSVSARPCAQAKRSATAVIPATPRPPRTTLRRLIWKVESLIAASVSEWSRDREASINALQGVACGGGDLSQFLSQEVDQRAYLGGGARTRRKYGIHVDRCELVA